MYHKIGTPPATSTAKFLWVSVDMFRRQMGYLKRRGLQPLTLREIALAVDSGQPIPKNAVVLTFDDGYQNNYKNAFPILREFNYKAVFFLVTNAIGRDNFWHDPSREARLPMVSWDEVEEMENAGMEIGSHALNHPSLSSLSAEDVRRELVESREALARRLSQAPCSFANPYGNASDDLPVQKEIQNAGYRWALSIQQGKADVQGNPYCLKRLFILGNDTMYDFHLNITRGQARF
jgi:peptidoglycan/xylan/chitin deacetylase (PgdA/CDA1 family)